MQKARRSKSDRAEMKSTNETRMRGSWRPDKEDRSMVNNQFFPGRQRENLCGGITE
jgi:hypothetical protein